MRISRKKSVLVWASVVLVSAVFLLGWGSNLTSSMFNGGSVCYLQSDIDIKTVEGSALEKSISQLEEQKETKIREIDDNTMNINSITAQMDTERMNAEMSAQMEMQFLSGQTETLEDWAGAVDNEVAQMEKNKMEALLEQKNALENREKLIADVSIKKQALANNRALLATVSKNKAANQKSYNAISAQYTAKADLDDLQEKLNSLPNPTTAQINAKKVLEKESAVLNPVNTIAENQLRDRKNLEAIGVARDAAKKLIPAKNKANYQSALAQYNTLVANYNAALQSYKSMYTSTLYKNTLTAAQLSVKIDAQNAKIQIYQNLLNSYTATYGDSSSTSAQLQTQTRLYTRADKNLGNKVKAYDKKYSKTNTLTLSTLAQKKTRLATVLTEDEAVRATFAQSQTDYSASVTLSNSTKQDYDAKYSRSRLTVAQLTTLVQEAQERYDLEATQEGVVQVEVSPQSTLELERLEKRREQLEQEKIIIENTLSDVQTQKSRLDIDLSNMNTNMCSLTNNDINTGIANNGEGNIKDVITCTIVDYAYHFEHSNGSTDFSKSVFSLGWSDPYTVIYDVEYAQTSITFKAETYIDWEKINCPSIIVEMESTEEPLETCREIIEWLSSEEEDTSSIKCTWDYSYQVKNVLPKPQKLWSLLGSNSLLSSFFGGNDGTNNYYSYNENNSGDYGSNYNSTNYEDDGTNATCGNRREENGETCDDGNMMDGDGCSSSCQTESGSPMMDSTSSGMANDGNGGMSEEDIQKGQAAVEAEEREAQRCGNGVVGGNEQCDDGNVQNGDWCSDSCIREEEIYMAEDCDIDTTGLESSVFSGWWMLKSSLFGKKDCPPAEPKKPGKWCMVKGAKNYDESAKKDDGSCICGGSEKNRLDPYEYASCQCQPTYEWCYLPKGGICKKAKAPRKILVWALRNSPGYALTAAAWPAGFIPTPVVPVNANFNFSKPKNIAELFWVTGKVEDGKYKSECSGLKQKEG